MRYLFSNGVEDERIFVPAGMLISLFPVPHRSARLFILRGRRQGTNVSPTMQARIEAFTTELIAERAASGEIDLETMSFADMEMLSHQIGRRVARQLGANLAQQQGELYSDDDNCPICGIDCEVMIVPAGQFA